MPASFTAQQLVAAPASEVFRAFTNATALREWLPNVAVVRAELGGRLYLGWDRGYGVVGNFTALEPGTHVAFTWVGSNDPGHSEVDVTLEPAGSGTKVTLTQTWPEGEGWEEFERWVRTWPKDLENLASVLETGEDLRFTLRPMMGVLLDAEVTPERASKYGVPVDHGVVLSGTREGMGAHSAGLTGGDVIVRIGGTPITGFSSFAVALQPHRAGETVEVVYYREGQECHADMTLSGRPIPELPKTAGELARVARELFNWVDAELVECFAGATDAATRARPSPEEWSAREVLAHLLDGEGDTHSYITDLVMGAERVGDGAFENSDLRIKATAGSFATADDMLAAYRRLENQTVTLLAGLPDEFVARKGSFWRLAYGYVEANEHYVEHFDQIRAALAAAQG